ncbi:hypothetical protein ACOSQ3_017801 [Xanthoceras sorbifolium]
MDEEIATRYWCHMCSQIVIPVMEVEMKCPFCQSGCVEEMGSINSDNNQDHQPDSEFGSDRSLSLWAPVLLGMMGNQRSHPGRFRRAIVEEEEEDDDDDDSENHDDLDAELESIMTRRRRRRSSATIMQLLQGIRAGMQSESENNENGRDRDRDRERERLILINPFNQTIIVQGSYDGQNQNQNQNQTPVGSLGDYFIGPGLDLLLQHLAENDPNRYGTPPAQKEAVEAMPSVKIEETLQCSVCLDDFEIGSEAKQMPCKHKFHSDCIFPWLELHSSCPVCRYQLPADESKLESERSRNSNNPRESEHNNGDYGSGEEGSGEGRSESGRRFSIPWPFSIFSSSSSQSGGNNSTSGSGSGSQFGTASRTDEN